MYLLGYDIGSSSVKATITEAASGKKTASAFSPKQEMPIKALHPGWAEQDPDIWWNNLKLATKEIISRSDIDAGKIRAIGISYQMHGLVMVDNHYKVLRPSIIWCDSRAVPYGEKAFQELGTNKCLSHLLNSPGNFSAMKLAWVKENEPEIYRKIFKIMLPGDYIAMRMSGVINTTVSGLSEGIFWDFKNNETASFLLKHAGIDKAFLPDIVPTFSVQSEISPSTAKELGLKAGTKISYRAGDQPNNAFSLNVLNPGEIAATAGTSGVVYGITDQVKYDPLSRVNTFAHVNHSIGKNSLGVLLCINGTGILYSWLRKNTGQSNTGYDILNKQAEQVKIGSDDLCILPFGNGAERMLGNANTGCEICNLNFNIHNQSHLIRAAQEGIAFSFKYGMDIMKTTGIQPSLIKAGNSNLFLSTVFRNTLAGITGAVIEIYDTDGSEGAAKGAGIGAGIYSGFEEAFKTLKKLEVIEPDTKKADEYLSAYKKWTCNLERFVNKK